uniref:Regulator of G protein signaling 9 binding protein n=1 Tax=Monopterus albus TaxID=43700 RepID=A0A3Q3Q4D7_MONAL
MSLVNNKVGDNCMAGTDEVLADGKAQVESLIKVVACYRHLASYVGGWTDSLQLRDEVQQTQKKAQKLAVIICHHLTSHLQDKSLPQEKRKEMELLWVAFSSSLELLHVDMCKVFHIGNTFSLPSFVNLVQTGIQGGGSEIAARALNLSDPNQAQRLTPPAGIDDAEHSTMEQEISQIGHMIDDMEMKVSVLHWVVEPHGPQRAEPLSSTDSTSLALLSMDEEQSGHQPLYQQSHIFVLLLLFSVIWVTANLFVCVIFFS